MMSSDVSIEKVEVFDVELARYLAGSCTDVTFVEKKYLKEMLKNLTQKGLVVHYKYGIHSRTTEIHGRWFAKRACLSRFRRDVRNSLASKYYWDIDLWLVKTKY